MAGIPKSNQDIRSIKALVVGYGSIGSRHTRLLKELGCSVAVVSRRTIKEERCFSDLASALEEETPGYVVIANETEEHYHTFSLLAASGFAGKVLVEKPLFHSVQNPSANKFSLIGIGYHLRFNPLIQRLRQALEGEKIISTHVLTGLYLPLWRPWQDYRSGYSARKPGGGVLRDISHELDFSLWLLGGWEKVVAAGGHLSSLDIESDDVFSLLVETPKSPILSIQLNYLDRASRREVIVNTDKHTIKVDLIQQSLQIDKEIIEVPCDRDETFRSQHRAVLAGDIRSLCTLAEGLDLIRFIDCAERSVREQRWISK